MHPTSCIRLGRAQASMFHAARGTTIVSTRGRFLVSESGSAADTHFTVSEGECHVVQRSGWVRLQASGSAPCTAAVSAGMAAVPWWRRWSRRMFILAALKG